MTDAMNLGMTERLKPLHEKVATMIQEDVLPVDEEFLAEVNVGDRWQYTSRQTDRNRESCCLEVCWLLLSFK